jgi:hypothetical protein
MQLSKVGAPKRQSRRRGRGGVDALASGLVTTGRGVPASLGADRLLGVSQSLVRDLSDNYNTQTTTTAGSYNEPFVVVLNSAYAGIVGASATGYSKYMQFYSKCFVVGARVRLWFTVIGAASAPVMVGSVITTNSSTLGSLGLAVDNGLCRYKPLFSNPDTCSVEQTLDVSRFLHKPRVLDDPQLFSTSSAGPTQTIVCHPFVNNDNVGASQVVSIFCEVVYKCVFTDPVPFT